MYRTHGTATVDLEELRHLENLAGKLKEIDKHLEKKECVFLRTKIYQGYDSGTVNHLGEDTEVILFTKEEAMKNIAEKMGDLVKQRDKAVYELAELKVEYSTVTRKKWYQFVKI